MKEKCPFCQNNSLKIFIKNKKRKLVECQNCSLLFVSPLPNNEKIKELNKKDSKKFFQDYLREETQKKKQFRRYLSLILKNKKDGKILDVGCALGFFLEEAIKSGFKASGVDLLDFAVKFCHKKGFDKVFQSSLEESKFPSSSFDIVTAFHTVEHYSNPDMFFISAKKLLKNNGLLMIAVPNRKSLTARILRKHWFGYHHPQHLLFFEKKTLGNFLAKHGFKIIEWGEEKGIEWFLVNLSWERFRFYYRSSILFNLVNIGKILFNLLQIKRIPILTGHIWVIAEKLAD